MNDVKVELEVAYRIGVERLPKRDAAAPLSGHLGGVSAGNDAPHGTLSSQALSVRECLATTRGGVGSVCGVSSV